MRACTLAAITSFAVSFCWLLVFAVDWLTAGSVVFMDARSATATAIVSAGTSKPKNRNFSFITGSLPLVALNCAFF
jgi:hypothetical protein